MHDHSLLVKDTAIMAERKLNANSPFSRNVTYVTRSLKEVLKMLCDMNIFSICLFDSYPKKPSVHMVMVPNGTRLSRN